MSERRPSYRQADALRAPKPSSNLAFRAPRTSKRLSCSASSDMPRQSSFIPQASPSSHRRARMGLVLLDRKSLLHRVGNFSLKPRFFSGILVDQAPRGSATVDKSLLFADLQGFLQRRVSSRLGAQPPFLCAVHTRGTGEPSDRKGPRVARPACLAVETAASSWMKTTHLIWAPHRQPCAQRRPSCSAYSNSRVTSRSNSERSPRIFSR